MKKSNLIVSFTAVIILLSWLIFSVSQPPEWTGKSADGTWKTIYEVEYSPKNTWKGSIHWKGEGDATVSQVQLNRNGSVIHGWNTNVDVINGTSYDYLSLGGAFDNREDEYVLTIYWTDNEGHHNSSFNLCCRSLNGFI